MPAADLFPTARGRTWTYLVGGGAPETSDYRSTFVVDDGGTIAVPAGTFATVRETTTISITGFGTRSVTAWVAPRVGLIREEDNVGGTRELVTSNLLP